MSTLRTLLALVACATLWGEDGQMVKARLLSPISTKTSQENDRITAVVVEPPQFNQAVLEGRIRKLKAPQRGIGKGKPELAFAFETITANGKTQPINADLTEISNSKGVKNVDEEGQIIGRTSNAKRAWMTALGAGVGAAAGAAASSSADRAKGAGTGAALGGAAGLALSVTLTTTGQDMNLQPGAELTLRLSNRNR